MSSPPAQLLCRPAMNSIRNAIGIVRNICVAMALFLLGAPFANALVVSPSTMKINGAVYESFAAYCSGGTGAVNVITKYSNGFQGSCADGFKSGLTWTVVYTCPSGSNYDQNAAACIAPDPPQRCAGYDSPVAAATNFQWLKAPISCGAIGSNGVVTCTGTDGAGKPSSQDIQCNGGSSGVGSGPSPAPVPNPPPAVDVDYPKCPVGTYKYTDIDGSSTCSTPQRPDDSSPCASGNVGTINGKYSCLPSNPAPDVAKSAANAAQSKADTARANPGTDAAKAAAGGAASDAQRASDASKSLPPDSPMAAGTAGDAQKAIDAAKQAAGYAGTPYTGPGGPANGTEGPKECGGPGRPKCQIDESGTPNGTGAYDSANSGLDKAYGDANTALGTVTSSNGKDTSWGFSWSSWIRPGACQPLNLGTFPIIEKAIAFDMCPALSMASEFISFMWVLGTIGLILSMVWGTIQSQG